MWRNMPPDHPPRLEALIRHFAYDKIADSYPQILDKLHLLGEALSAEEVYSRMVSNANEFWSEMKTDIDKIQEQKEKEQYRVCHQVKNLAVDLLHDIYLYNGAITGFHGELIGGTYLKMIIAFRNFYEHGEQTLPVVYKHSTRENPKTKFSLNMDLVLLMEHLASGKKRMRKENIKKISELLSEVGNFANLSDLFETVVFDAVESYPVISEIAKSETEAAIRELETLKGIVEDNDEMREEILVAIDDHISRDQLRAELAKENANLIIEVD